MINLQDAIRWTEREFPAAPMASAEAANVRALAQAKAAFLRDTLTQAAAFVGTVKGLAALPAKSRPDFDRTWDKTAEAITAEIEKPPGPTFPEALRGLLAGEIRDTTPGEILRGLLVAHLAYRDLIPALPAVSPVFLLALNLAEGRLAEAATLLSGEILHAETTTGRKSLTLGKISAAPKQRKRTRRARATIERFEALGLEPMFRENPYKAHTELIQSTIKKPLTDEKGKVKPYEKDTFVEILSAHLGIDRKPQKRPS